MKKPTPVRSRKARSRSVEPLEARLAPAVIGFSVASIDRDTPAPSEVQTDAVGFKVTFNNPGGNPITGLDASDFEVVTTGNLKADATVLVTGTVDPNVYNVSVMGIKGNGYVGLNLVDDGTIFTDNSETGLGGSGTLNGSFTGETYHVVQTHPTVTSIVRAATNPTNSSSVSWTVTFSEQVAIADVGTDDFSFPTEGLTSPTTTSVVPTDAEGNYATTYTVTASGYVGQGLIALNLVDDGSIHDREGNPLQTDPISYSSASLAGSGFSPVAVVTGDINEDGKTDIVAADYNSGMLLVLIGDGQGGFTQQSNIIVGSNPRDIALADLNGDGHLDIAITEFAFNPANSSFTSVTVMMGDGQGGFGAQQHYGFANQHLAIAVGDVNGDGKPDIVQTSQSGIGFVNVLIGNGDGTFQNPQTYATGQEPRAVVLADLDGDGLTDIVTANFGSDNVGVLRNQGGGQFSSAFFSVGFAPADLDVADLDGDGKLDIVTANNSDGTVSVLHNASSSVGSISFSSHVDYDTGTSPGSTSPSGVALTDVDGDGRIDIVSTSGVFFAVQGAQPEQGAVLTGLVSVLHNDGAGTFNGTTPYVIGTNAFDALALSIADFNGDGRPDIVTVGTTQQAVIPPEQGAEQLGLPFGVVDVLLNNGHGDTNGEIYTITAPAVDLTVTSVTDTKNSAAPGDLLTYTINYGNIGSAATNSSSVVLTVQLDPNLDFVGSENTGWSLNGSTLTKTLVGGLAAGATGSSTLKLHVKSTIDGFSSTVATTATISGGGDGNSENNSASDYDLLTGVSHDLTVTKIDDPKVAVEFRTATFLIHYANLGNRNLTDVPLTVTLPAGSSINNGLSDPRFSSGFGTVTAYVDVPGNSGDQTISLVINVGFSSGAAELTTTAAFDEEGDSNSANDSATEDTPLYHGYVVTAPGVAIKKKYAPSILRVFDRLSGEELFTINAYGNYRDSIRVALGDFNFDGIDDIVTTTSRGTGKLRIFDGATGDQLINEFAVFDGRRDRGAFVAVGDLDGFGLPEIIVGSALGGGKVRVYSFQQPTAQPEEGGSQLPPLQMIKQFTPFGARFKGGVRVAAGDVDRFGFGEALPEDGKSILNDDIVVGQGYYGSKVIAYNGEVMFSSPGQESNFEIGEIKVGGPRFRGGVSVALGDINDDGHADIITGRNTGRPSVVEVFDARSLSTDPNTARHFGPEENPLLNPFDTDPLHPKNTFGVRVAAADVNGDGIADIIVSVGIKNKSLVKFYDGDDFASGTITEIMTPDPEHEGQFLRPLTAYSQFPNVALWIAGSSGNSSQRN